MGEMRITGSRRMWNGEFVHLPYLGTRSNVRLLWHSGYWDGPINGICLYEGRKCYFDTVEEVDLEELEDGEWEYGWSRRYVIFAMTPEELEREELVHARFREFVGVHTDYGEDGVRPVGSLRPQSEWSKFYDWAKTLPSRSIDRSRPLAWFGLVGPEHDTSAFAKKE